MHPAAAVIRCIRLSVLVAISIHLVFIILESNRIARESPTERARGMEWNRMEFSNTASKPTGSRGFDWARYAIGNNENQQNNITTCHLLLFCFIIFAPFPFDLCSTTRRRCVRLCAIIIRALARCLPASQSVLFVYSLRTALEPLTCTGTR